MWHLARQDRQYEGLYFVGGRYDYDLASDSKATMAEDLLKLRRGNLSANMDWVSIFTSRFLYCRPK